MLIRFLQCVGTLHVCGWAWSTICIHDVITHLIKSPRPSYHSVFAYCKQSKTGGRCVLGKRLRYSFAVVSI